MGIRDPIELEQQSECDCYGRERYPRFFVHVGGRVPSKSGQIVNPQHGQRTQLKFKKPPEPKKVTFHQSQRKKT